MQTQMFNIEVKNNKVNAYRNITSGIVVFNIFFFIFLAFRSNEQKSTLPFLIVISLYAAYRYFISGKTRKGFFFDEWVFFLLMIIWQHNYVMGAVNLLFFLLYTAAVQKIRYSFTGSHIELLYFPWKKYKWDELSNVILKDNLLTMDFKNNKLMQAEIVNGDVDENEFNEFANRQLHSNRGQ